MTFKGFTHRGLYQPYLGVPEIELGPFGILSRCFTAQLWPLSKHYTDRSEGGGNYNQVEVRRDGSAVSNGERFTCYLSESQAIIRGTRVRGANIGSITVPQNFLKVLPFSSHTVLKQFPFKCIKAVKDLPALPIAEPPALIWKPAAHSVALEELLSAQFSWRMSSSNTTHTRARGACSGPRLAGHLEDQLTKTCSGNGENNC